MTQPKTKEELTNAGWRFVAKADCHGTDCHAPIAWYETPQKRLMPLDPDTLEPHWATCPNSAKFKRKRPAK